MDFNSRQMIDDKEVGWLVGSSGLVRKRPRGHDQYWGDLWATHQSGF